MANDPSACVHLGYYKDGVPVYGLCEDKQENLMTSCYSLLDGQQTEDVTCADGNTYTVAGNENSYEFDSSSSGCNLDKANGGFSRILQILISTFLSKVQFIRPPAITPIS